jgi:hypothetical protein
MSTLNLKAEVEPSFVISADDQFESGVDFKLYEIAE